jgi:hypothetical protein
MLTLRANIESLAQTFATQVLGAIRASSLESILAETSSKGRGPGRPPAALSVRTVSKRGPGRPPGPTSKRLGRRSAKDLAKTASAIVALVKQRQGLRAEQIRAELQIPKNAWARPLALALASKKLSKKGEKRATAYYAR